MVAKIFCVKCNIQTKPTGKHLIRPKDYYGVMLEEEIRFPTYECPKCKYEGNPYADDNLEFRWN